ncbi:uncharacterized protein LOC135847040 [Planococcus citri]|uniref:uncharacterized protein LOC135847040 n=1 Tax=Planococcus citri TaxID=170843 RepID=UPI0031F9293A
MEITNDLLSKILSGDSQCKITIQQWHIQKNVFLQSNNHTSELSKLIVEYQRKGKTFKKSFVLKVPSAHPMYDLGVKFKMYEKEYPMYTEVLEEMYKIDGEHIGAKLYYSDNKYSLMMKDLTLSGYKVVDKVKQLDYHQCYMVLRKLAKFHALSVKLDRHSKISPALKRIPWLGEVELEESFKKYLNYAFEQLAKSVDSKFNLEEKILQCKDYVFDELMQEMTSNQLIFKVLTHGDLWLGNTLFKFNKYGQAMKVKFIDFQCPSWSSPVFDILCFTLTSMRFEVFERHFDFLMETYVEALNDTLKFFQCGSYSLEELRRDMDILHSSAMIFLCCHLPQALSNLEQPLDYQRYYIDGVVDFRIYDAFFKNETYLKTLNKWIGYYVKKGWFDRI